MGSLLATYLNDHLAAATAGVELARRARGSNDAGELGAFLAALAAELEEDRATLEAVMDAAGAGRDRLKVGAAWAGEKVGRLKLNGRLVGYSPLSRLVELEGLRLAEDAQASLWRLLGELADPRLARFDFAALAQRAERRRDRLERWRIDAGRTALAAGDSSATAPGP